jgi:multidrug efflux pump subunit AcrA (membrane-fusion protein)
MKLIKVLCILCLISCSSKNPLDDLPYFTVKKNNFVNSVTVYGTIESGRMINYNCPVQGYDLTISHLVPEGSIAVKGDTICRLTCADMENNYLEAVKGFDLAKSDYEKTQAQQALEMEILKSQVKSIEASTSISMLDSSQLEFYSPARRKISELTLEKAQINKNKFLRKIEYMERINGAILNKLKLRIQQKENQVKRYQEQLSKLKIVADTSGIVQYANIPWSGEKVKIGTIVWGRLPILNIIDIGSLQVRLNMNESYFKLIQKDNRLDIRIDAFDTSLYKGKITMKFPEGKSYGNESKVKYFEALSTIEPMPKKVQPGVSVTCTIYLNEIKDTIAVPLISVFEYDSSKVVYVKSGEKCHRVKVKTGISSEKEVVISSGLKANDKIMLSEPPESLLQ